MPLKKKVQSVQKVVKKQPSAHQPQKGGKRTDYIAAVGRRKTAVARVRLFRGKGDSIVNDKPFTTYFKDAVNKGVVLSPLLTTGTDAAAWFTVKVIGGGVKAQAQAIAHGLSRALVKLSEENKLPLRRKGLMTRDPRMKETRKIGTGGKARRAKQSPKR
jgi:small subunit ribosomal protein S9